MGYFQDLNKKFNKEKDKVSEVAKGPVANILTGGLSGSAAELAKGRKANVGQAIVNSATFGASGINGKGGAEEAVTAVGEAIGNPFAGLSNPFSTQAADSSGYIRNVNQIVDPAMGKFNDLGNTTISGGNVDPAFRQYQMSVAQQLQQQALGQGPSLAQMQLQQATDRTLNQSLGQIRAATGPNAALAGRTGALAAAQQMGQYGNASGQLRLQEQQQAQAALAGLANQGRTGDATIRGQDIQAQTATAETRLGAADGYGNLAGEKVKAEGKVLDHQQEAEIQKSKNATEMGKAVVSGVADGASAAAKIFSDEKMKKNVKPGDVQALLKTISAKEYDYKDSKHGEGKHFGVMAQDLEKTPYGKSMVIDTPQGKMVDTRKVAMAALAGVAALTKKKAKE